MTDEKLLSALDLLDSLVDGNIDTVTKSRVVAWKKMMRAEIAKEPESSEAAMIVAQSIMDQQAWVPGMDIAPDQALIMAGVVISDLAPVFAKLSSLACPLDHNMCPRAWTKENET